MGRGPPAEGPPRGVSHSAPALRGSARGRLAPQPQPPAGSAPPAPGTPPAAPACELLREGGAEPAGRGGRRRLQMGVQRPSSPAFRRDRRRPGGGAAWGLDRRGPGDGPGAGPPGPERAGGSPTACARAWARRSRGAGAMPGAVGAPAGPGNPGAPARAGFLPQQRAAFLGLAPSGAPLPGCAAVDCSIPS